MFESASSSIWASMNNWLTPTVLFLLLNFMIGTIAFTSIFSNQKQNPSQNDPKITRSSSVLQRLKSTNLYTHFRSQQEPKNSPLHHKQNPDYNSNTHQTQVLETESSFFQENHEKSQIQYFFEENDGHNLEKTQAHFDFDQKDWNLDGFEFEETHENRVEEDERQSMDEVYSKLTGSHVLRTTSDTEPSAGRIPSKLPAKMKKSASMKSSFGHFKAVDIVETRRPETMREKKISELSDVDEEVDAKADDFINKFRLQLKLQKLDSISRYKDLIGRGSG